MEDDLTYDVGGKGVANTLDDHEFLDDIGLGTDGEHRTVADDDADGGAWSPISS